MPESVYDPLDGAFENASDRLREEAAMFIMGGRRNELRDAADDLERAARRAAADLAAARKDRDDALEYAHSFADVLTAMDMHAGTIDPFRERFPKPGDVS